MMLLAHDLGGSEGVGPVLACSWPMFRDDRREA